VSRRTLVAGNWKMHGTLAQARDLALALRPLAVPDDVDVAVFPPFTALAAVASVLAETAIALGAQTMHDAPAGAFTGEISAPMLVDLDVRYVILGHSERRLFDGETDAAVARKVAAALAYGLVPIVAVGDTRAEHEAGHAAQRVAAQARAALGALAPEDVARCVVAYEPIWAIGTGLSCDPTIANRIMGAIRGAVPGLACARIIYGGSMKAENAAELFAQPEIDGGLIGGASLDPATFVAIVRTARVRQAVTG